MVFWTTSSTNCFALEVARGVSIYVVAEDPPIRLWSPSPFYPSPEALPVWLQLGQLPKAFITLGQVQDHFRSRGVLAHFFTLSKKVGCHFLVPC